MRVQDSFSANGRAVEEITPRAQLSASGLMRGSVILLCHVMSTFLRHALYTLVFSLLP